MIKKTAENILGSFEEITENILGLFDKYIDWLDNLNPLLAVMIFVISIALSIVLVCSIAAKVEIQIHKRICLESVQPRRYHAPICEEYTDGKWVEIDAREKEPIYHYNEEAVKVNE